MTSTDVDQHAPYYAFHVSENNGDVAKDVRRPYKIHEFTVFSQNKMSSQIHHKFRRCPLEGCDYYGGDLKRHLQSKKHHDEVNPDMIDSLVQLTDKGKMRKGKNRLLYRWCPIDGCSFLTCYLRKHLKHAHGINISRKLDSLRSKAEVYRPSQLPSGTAVVEEVDSDENEDDDEYVQPGAKAFYETRRIATDRHWFLVEFYNHLGTVDEGQKAERVRFQHASQVRRILEDIDPGGKDIQALVGDDGRAVWNAWIAPRLQDDSVATGTLFSYLGSLNKFLKFVVRRFRRRQSSESGPFLSEDTCEVFCDIMDSTGGWRSTIAKQRAVRQNEHYLKECERRLTKEDFKAFLRSPVIVEAESLFSSTATAEGTFQFVRARDYLIARLAVSCGTRPRPLETATVEHFSQASRDSEFPHCFVMLVPKHKRQTDGPAIVTMDERLYEYVRVYVRDIRPKFVDSADEKHLFVTKEGKPFAPGSIGTRVTHLWNRTGVRPDLRVSCTDFRKCIVTMVEEANKKQRIRTGRPLIDTGDVRKLLCHSERTAAIWYMRENLTAIGARAHTALERIRDGGLDETSDDDDRAGIGVSDVSDSGTPVSNDVEMQAGSGHGNRPDAEFLTRSTNNESSSEQRDLPVIAPAPVPYNCQQAPVPEVPAAPPRKRRDWSRRDSDLFVQFVKQFGDKCPGQRTIYDGCYTSPELKVILDREGLRRCVEKVRTTFKRLHAQEKF